MAKVFVHYEEGVDEALHTTLKITLPKKWMNGPISKILKTFIDTCVHAARPPSHAPVSSHGHLVSPPVH